ncbi:DNA topology modulation protein [Saccharibacillus sacchari]|uniref:DNA topology modulation protein n=1 Tax=Saccharibacillus sacchari TaxID=456493 RepID=A0ACC6P759_9BACL
MKKVAVIGSPGSGKSVFSRKLGESLGLPVIHLDSYYWQAGWTPTATKDWDEFLKKQVGADKWIIDGNYMRTLDIRLKAADTIVFLDLPRPLCMYRIIKRCFMYRAKSRPDLNADCEEKLDAKFIKWVWNYKKKSRPKVLESIRSQGQGKRTVVLSSRKEVEAFLKGLGKHKSQT